MVFPQTILGNKVEIYYDGGWHDISSDVRGIGAEDGEISIGQRGQPNESSGVVTTEAELSINNRDGKYSPRNTASVLYGKIGPNTPLRISTDISSTTDITDASEVHNHAATNTELSYEVDTVISDFDATVDSVALAAAPTGANITVTVRGRIDNAGTTWVQGRLVFLTGGTVQVGTDFSEAGVITSSTLVTVAGLSTTDAISLRVQLMGRTVRVRAWESGTAEPSTWNTSESTDVLTPGAIAVTSKLESGNSNALPFAITFTDLTVSLGIILATLEISEWPKKWDSTGRDVWVTLNASGVTRRLLQGNRPLGSPLHRALSRTTLTGYWSFEGLTGDISSHPAIQSTVSGGPPLTTYEVDDYNGVSVDWSGNSGLVGSDSLPSIGLASDNFAQLRFDSSNFTVDTAHNHYTIAFWLYSGLPGNTTNIDSSIDGFIELTGGTYSFVNFSVTQRDVAGVKDISIGLFADSGAFLATIPAQTYENRWRFFRFTVDQPIANNMRARTYVDEVLIDTQQNAGVAAIGQPLNTVFYYSNDNTSSETAFGHFAIGSGTGSDDLATRASTIYEAGATAHAGETATERMTRICDEQGVTLELITADGELGTLVGPQRSVNFVDLLEETAKTDDGVLYELRGEFGYGYRTRESLLAAPTRLTLDYTNTDLSSVPRVTDDDQRIRNQITAKRAGGGDGVTVEQTTGPLSTADPRDTPPGVGLYDDEITVNVYDNDQLADYAGWRVHLGTWDESRWPGVSVALERTPFSGNLGKLAAAAFLDIAEIFTIINTPAWLGQDDVVLQMRSVKVFLSNFSWGIDWSALPAGPWTDVATVQSGEFGRLDTTGSELVSAVDATATNILVFTDDDDPPLTGTLWTEDIGELNIFGYEGIDFRLNPASRVGGTGGERVRASVDTEVSDTFTRSGDLPASNADTGQAWSYVSGTASTATTDGTRAVFVHPSANTSMFVALTSGYADVCATVDISFNVSTTGGGNLSARVVFRQTDANNYYAAVLTLLSTGSTTAELSIVQVVGGSQTTLSSTSVTYGVTNTANTPIRVKAMIYNRGLWAKAWLASTGDADEPDWQIELPNAATALMSGTGVGLRTLRSTGNTTADATVYFDNLKVIRSKILPGYYDRFGRTVASGLGSADSGGAWTTISTGGVADPADFNVTGTAATARHPSTTSARGAYLDDVSIEDACVSLVWSAAVPTGAGLDVASVLLRGTSSTSYIRCRVNVTSSTGNFFDLAIYSAAGVQLGSLNMFSYTSYTSDTQYRLKAAAYGDQIMMKIWNPASPEPKTWQLTVTDPATPVAGWIGWLTERGSAFNTNANYTVSIRDFRMENPQRMELDRSVNGVSRAWDAGNDIRLWTPARLGR